MFSNAPLSPIPSMEKVTPLFPRNHPLKIEVLSRCPFWRFGRGFKPPTPYLPSPTRKWGCTLGDFRSSNKLIKRLLQHFFGAFSVCCCLRMLLFKRRRKYRKGYFLSYFKWMGLVSPYFSAQALLLKNPLAAVIKSYSLKFQILSSLIITIHSMFTIM